jgi:hypothetical protein
MPARAREGRTISLRAGDQPARAGRRRSVLEILRIASLDPAIVAPIGAVPPLLLGQFMPGHDHQQPEQLVGLVQFVLPRGHPHEEAGHYRLADIRPVEPAVEPRVAEAHPHLATDHRLVALDQLTGGLVVAGANPAHELGERGALGHDRLASCQRPIHIFLYHAAAPRSSAGPVPGAVAFSEVQIMIGGVRQRRQAGEAE